MLLKPWHTEPSSLRSERVEPEEGCLDPSCLVGTWTLSFSERNGWLHGELWAQLGGKVVRVDGFISFFGIWLGGREEVCLQRRSFWVLAWELICSILSIPILLFQVRVGLTGVEPTVESGNNGEEERLTERTLLPLARGRGACWVTTRSRVRGGLLRRNEPDWWLHLPLYE